MIDTFLFVGLPYVAVVVCAVATVYRLTRARTTVSAMSSQFLEGRGLRWGSGPWHAGVIVILLMHLVFLLAPPVTRTLFAVPWVLYTFEAIGIACSILCLAGLAVLAVRRLTSARVQAVTSVMDLVVLALLAVQVGLGLGVALHHRWGASWASGTLTPYLLSLATLQPDPSFVKDMPPLVKAHLAGAWLLVLIFPFSRLIHLISVPLQYLGREPQLVLWTSLRRIEQAVATRVLESRRLFLKGVAATAAGGTLLGIGVLDKLARFFQGPSLSDEKRAELMDRKLTRVRATVAERELELERLREDHIKIATLGELDPRKGRYFIDFEMRTALAFRGEDGFPLLISAKCTHLGCTVASEASPEGKILCPCHISYFDVKTGEPNPGAPAKTPLPHLDWVLVAPGGAVVARRTREGVEQLASESPLDDCEVYIAKRRTEKA